MAAPIKNSLPLDVPAPTTSAADRASAIGRRSSATGERFGHHLDRAIASHAAESRRRSNDDATSDSSPTSDRARLTRGAVTTTRSVRRHDPDVSDATTPVPSVAPVVVAPPVPADSAAQATIALSPTDRPSVEGVSSLVAVGAAGAATVAEAVDAAGVAASNVETAGVESPVQHTSATILSSIAAGASDVAATGATAPDAASSPTAVSPADGDGSFALPSAAMKGAPSAQVEQTAQVEKNAVTDVAIDEAVSHDIVETAAEPARLPADAVRALHAASGRSASLSSRAARDSNPAGASSTTGTSHVDATNVRASALDTSAPASTTAPGSAPSTTSASAFAAAAADADAALAATFSNATPAAHSSADLTSTADPAARRAGLPGVPLSLPSLSMDLSDEGLGPLTLQALSGDGVVHLKLTAADPAVGTMLSRAAGELRRDLEAGGTSVGTLDVGQSAPGQLGADHTGSGLGSGTGAGPDANSRDGRGGEPSTRSRPLAVPAPLMSTSKSHTVSDGVDVRI